MTILSQTARPAPRRLRDLIVSLLVRLCEADAAYRQRVHLRRISDEHLADMGLTRADAERGGRR